MANSVYEGEAIVVNGLTPTTEFASGDMTLLDSGGTPLLAVGDLGLNISIPLPSTEPGATGTTYFQIVANRTINDLDIVTIHNANDTDPYPIEDYVGFKLGSDTGTTYTIHNFNAGPLVSGSTTTIDIQIAPPPVDSGVITGVKHLYFDLVYDITLTDDELVSSSL